MITAAPRFFISYTNADIVWAEWVGQTLEDAGYRTVLQAWDFRPGDNFIQRMDQALAEADRVVAVLSAAYFGSEYTRDEWTAAQVRTRGEPDRLLPVRIEAVELPPLLASRPRGTGGDRAAAGWRATGPGQTTGTATVPERPGRNGWDLVPRS